MASARWTYSHFGAFPSLAALPVHAYACVLEKLKCLKPLQPDSWGTELGKAEREMPVLLRALAALLSRGSCQLDFPAGELAAIAVCSLNTENGGDLRHKKF